MVDIKKNETIVEQVRERYARIAELGDCGCSCGTTAEGASPAEVSARIGYDERALAIAPEGANLGLGCGAPVASLELRAGETVVDLGSGAGLDAFLAAREVGQFPLIVQMTVQDDGSTPTGTLPEDFARALDEWGADLIGVNCSVGPAAVQETLEPGQAQTWDDNRCQRSWKRLIGLQDQARVIDQHGAAKHVRRRPRLCRHGFREAQALEFGQGLLGWRQRNAQPVQFAFEGRVLGWI